MIFVIKKLITVFLALVVILSSFTLTSCDNNTAFNDDSAPGQKTEGYNELSFTALNTYINLKAACDEKDLQSIKTIIEDYSNEVDCMNKSELYSINNKSGGTVKGPLYYTIIDALNAYNDTNGYYNPLYYSLKEIWKIDDKSAKIPTDEQIKTALATANISNIETNGYSITLKNGAKLDLGGIAKGYIANSVVDKLRDNNINSGILSIGGTIATLGKNNGKKWRVAIQDPRGESNEQIGYLEVSSTFISTSGDYQQYKEIDNKRYHHIFDKSGKPADNNLTSVSVITTEGTASDALSTAFFAMGIEKSIEHCEKNNLNAVFVTKDNKVVITQGIKSKFTLTNDKYTLDIRKMNYEEPKL